MFHTQEKRSVLLRAPIICTKDNAWMGMAYYFWYDTDDAFFWGINSKKATGYFDIYSASINCEDVLDTVFNEEHYLFWKKQIEKAQTSFIKAGNVLTLKQLNDYFLQRGIWAKFGGIMFQTLASNVDYYIVKDFQYKKRIQLAVYNLGIMRLTLRSEIKGSASNSLITNIICWI